MNILQHINDGRYPIDDKGRPVVRSHCGSNITITATDGPGRWPIIGFGHGYASCWSAEGEWSCVAPAEFRGGVSFCNLAPPLPRKVRVTTWGLTDNHEHLICVNFRSAEDAAYGLTIHKGTRHIVRLTGEYEVP